MTLTVIERSLLSHELGDGVGRQKVTLGQVEDLLPGVLGQKLFLPESLEVDSIGEYGIGALVDRVLGQKIVDVVPSYVADPLVDLGAHRFGIRLEVDWLQLLVEEVEHAVAKLLRAAEPETVRHLVLVVARRVCLYVQKSWFIFGYIK